MSKLCRICGKELLDDSQFCDGCGTARTEINNQIETPNTSYSSTQLNGAVTEQNNSEPIKKKSIRKEILITTVVILTIIFIITVPKTLYRMIRDENTRSQIQINSGDEYIEIDQEKFARLLANELQSYDIPVSKIHKYKGTKWADKYRFDIDLENGEKIYLTSNHKDTIERIICRGDPKKKESSLGNIVGVITMLLVPSTTDNDLEKLNKTFFKYDNLNSMFGEDYKYGNLVYLWYWEKVDNSFFQITIMTEGHYEAINSK